MQDQTDSNSTEPHATIKLGIDAHAKWYYVARQVDGATPQPVQKMTFDGLLDFVAKQQHLVWEVFTCYEAGAIGFHLPEDGVALSVLSLWWLKLPRALPWAVMSRPVGPEAATRARSLIRLPTSSHKSWLRERVRMSV